MTDSTTPDGANPPADQSDQGGERDQAGRRDEAAEREGRTDDPTRAGDELPESTTDAAPLSDSTEGGLDGGDPGVEE